MTCSQCGIEFNADKFYTCDNCRREQVENYYNQLTTNGNVWIFTPSLRGIKC